jgi:hypothetical protein
MFNNEKKILRSYIQTCDRHADKLQTAIVKTAPLFPLTLNIFSNLDEINSAFLDVISTRFAKLQDTCGQNIFPLVLVCSGEDIAGRTFIDILNRLEKFKFMEDANFWLELRRSRNAIAHEYPDNLDKLVITINEIYGQSNALLTYWQTLKEKIYQTILT